MLFKTISILEFYYQVGKYCEMSKPNLLVDRKALEMNRNRANGRDEYFLHELAIAEIKDRLSIINRDFQSIAIVSGLSTPWGPLPILVPEG